MTITEGELTLAAKLATKTARRWSAVEVEDLRQELYVWLYENAEKVARYRSAEGGEGMLFTALRRVANRYCVREQEARNGAPLDAGAEYTVEQIERALPFIFEGAPTGAVAVNPLTGEALESRGDYGLALAVLIDLGGAFRDMPEAVREVLALRYRDGMTHAEIAALAGLTEEGARQRVRRAVRRLRDRLCGRV